MSENEYKKLRRQLRLLTFTVVLFIFLAVASLVHRWVAPQSASLPKVQVVQGKPGKDAVIDYSAIDSYINAKIASLPKPLNGANGQNGTNGVAGQSIQGFVGPAGADGASVTGAQGDPGAPGAQIELRYNTAKQQTEWRYTGQLTWQVLVTNCQILGTC